MKTIFPSSLNLQARFTWPYNHAGNRKQFALPVALVYLLLFSGLSGLAQTYTGNLNLTTQIQVDAFNYTEVTGVLFISGSDIENLDGLSSLSTVGGNLDIFSNGMLSDVDGLSSLSMVGGTCGF